MIDDCDAMDDSLCHDCRELRFRALVRLALSLARDDAILHPEADVRLARTYGRCLDLVDAHILDDEDPDDDLDDFIADEEDEDEEDPDED